VVSSGIIFIEVCANPSTGSKVERRHIHTDNMVIRSVCFLQLRKREVSLRKERIRNKTRETTQSPLKGE
jgi:hypothetical protein